MTHINSSDSSSFSQQFNNAAQGPVVAVDVLNMDLNRGDSHGWRGLAQSVAQQLDARLDVLTSESVLDGQAVHDYLNDYLSTNGRPDIYIGREHLKDNRAFQQSDGFTHHVHGLNEHIPRRYGVTNSLVPHHISANDLESAGQALRLTPFFEANAGKQVVVVLSGVVSFFLKDNDPVSVARSIHASLSGHSDTTVFYLPNSKTFNVHIEAFEAEMGRLNASRLKKWWNNTPDVTVKTWQFGDTKTANPYLGLLDQADHIVMWGESQSMLSEALMTGKTVYVPQPDLVADVLKNDGFVKPLKGNRFETQRFPSLNATDDVARKVIDHFVVQRQEWQQGMSANRRIA